MEARRMNHRERLETCLAGGNPDRPPVALWRHFPVDDQNPAHLANATLDFQKNYDFDLVKVTPASSFCVKDWGVQDEWHGDAEGTRDYTVKAIGHPEDWTRLRVLDPYQGSLALQLSCLSQIVQGLEGKVPVIQTVFSPLAQAKNLVGREMLLVHLRQNPQAVHTGLNTILKSTQLFLEAAMKTGIDGIFYAVQHARFSLLSKKEYLEFGKAYDLPLLETAQSLWLNMLHLHGDHVMFDLVTDYPVGIINWHDRDTPPSLRGGQDHFSGVVCGGLQREKTMVLGTPDEVLAEARDAILATGGERFILGTGCVLPITAPRGNILAARQSVEMGV